MESRALAYLSALWEPALLPQPTQPRAWGPSHFTQLPEGTQVSRCQFRVSRKKFRTTLDKRRSLPARSPLQPGNGAQGQAGQSSHSWKTGCQTLSEEAACSVGDRLLSLLERKTGQESFLKDKPRGFGSWHPQQACLACRLSGAISCSEIASPPLLDAEGPGGSPPPALVPQSATQEGGSAPLDPRRLRVPGVSPQSHQNILEASAT